MKMRGKNFKSFKDFFRIDKRKLIISIVLSVWSFFGLSILNENLWQETFFSRFLLFLVSIGFYFFSMIPYNITTLTLEDLLYPYIGSGMMIIFFVLLFVYNYVISCLVLWVYNRIRKLK